MCSWRTEFKDVRHPRFRRMAGTRPGCGINYRGAVYILDVQPMLFGERAFVDRHVTASRYQRPIFVSVDMAVERLVWQDVSGSANRHRLKLTGGS